MDEPTNKSTADPPLVSVVIPTCNRRAILERCLSSMTAQSYPNVEIIVVDDASTDDTPAFLERFTKEHPNPPIRVLRNDTHAGANPSRNRGIAQTKGAFVAFADDDCIAEFDWLANLVRGFARESVAAVVGWVNSPRPTNLYELTLKGTQRVPGPGKANRLVGCNMCLRRDVLVSYMLDEDRATTARYADGSVDVTVSGRGDEEGLFLSLRSAGYEQLAVPDAVVLHEHHHTRRSFFKQAFRSGRSAARLVYKFYLPPRLDLLPFVLTYLTLPLVLLGWRYGIVPASFSCGALAAITYNDLFRKGKTVGETALTLPVLLVYYHVRLAGYLIEAVALRLGLRRVKRQRLTNR